MLLQKFVRLLDLDRKSHTLYQSCVFQLLAGEELHCQSFGPSPRRGASARDRLPKSWG